MTSWFRRGRPLVYCVLVLATCWGYFVVTKPIQRIYENTKIEVFDAVSWSQLLAAIRTEALDGSGPGWKIQQLSAGATALSGAIRATPNDLKDPGVVGQIVDELNSVLSHQSLCDSSVWGFDIQPLVETVRPPSYRHTPDWHDFTGLERRHLNVLAFRQHYGNQIVPRSYALTHLIFHGVARRLDDASFWSILAALLGGTAITVAWSKRSSLLAADRSEPRPAWWLYAIQFFLTVGAVWLYLAGVSSPTDPGTFFWHDHGHSNEPQIKVIQFLEGCLVVASIVAVYFFLSFGSALVLRGWAEKRRRHTLGEDDLRVISWIALGTSIPFFIMALARWVYALGSEALGVRFQYFPKSLDFVGFIVVGVFWYIGFFALLAASGSLLWSSHAPLRTKLVGATLPVPLAILLLLLARIMGP